MNEHLTGLNIEEIENALSENKILKNISYFQKIDSTNDYAESMIENSSASSGTIIIADEQTQGHGRKSRSWFSPKFVNFYGTLIIKNKIEPQDSFFLTIITSLAVYETLQHYKIKNCTIKWPNDILAGKKKIAGILTKILKGYCLIGIGVNINWNPANSLELKNKAASLAQIQKQKIKREPFISRLLTIWEKYYCQYFHNKTDLLKKWEKNLYLPDKEISVYSDGRLFKGKIKKIQTDGGLVLNTSEKEIILYNIDKF